MITRLTKQMMKKTMRAIRLCRIRLLMTPAMNRIEWIFMTDAEQFFKMDWFGEWCAMIETFYEAGVWRKSVTCLTFHIVLFDQLSIITSLDTLTSFLKNLEVEDSSKKYE